MLTGRRSGDTHDEANSRFAQSYEHVYKLKGHLHQDRFAIVVYDFFFKFSVVTSQCPNHLRVFKVG